eukprot:513787-Hanusia_phi.AAC.1
MRPYGLLMFFSRGCRTVQRFESSSAESRTSPRIVPGPGPNYSAPDLTINTKISSGQPEKTEMMSRAPSTVRASMFQRRRGSLSAPPREPLIPCFETG